METKYGELKAEFVMEGESVAEKLAGHCADTNDGFQAVAIMVNESVFERLMNEDEHWNIECLTVYHRGKSDQHEYDERRITIAGVPVVRWPQERFPVPEMVNCEVIWW